MIVGQNHVGTFDARWITGWAASQLSRDGEMPWRSHRLAEKAKWMVDVFDSQASNQTIAAMVLAKDQLWIAGSDGDLRVLSADDGKLVTKHDLPAPLWDGMAIAKGRLYVSTVDGMYFMPLGCESRTAGVKPAA
jgi:outer membrane protein assembly factor BamB